MDLSLANSLQELEACASGFIFCRSEPRETSLSHEEAQRLELAAVLVDQLDLVQISVI